MFVQWQERQAQVYIQERNSVQSVTKDSQYDVSRTAFIDCILPSLHQLPHQLFYSPNNTNIL